MLATLGLVVVAVLAAEVVGPYTVGLVALVLVGAPITTRYLRRSLAAQLGPVRVQLGEMSTALEQVNRQVNHVQDPDNEPTLREIACDLRDELAELRTDVLRVDRRCSSVETAQLMQAERLSEIGTLARRTADAVEASRP
ncbi:MAG TPA: hypothetical protein VFU14_20220 [Acidimicrobiales bacterium]|nr:hypothetical protein [Acidimicrobiales bacterium]